jgi:hypothetical protein
MAMTRAGSKALKATQAAYAAHRKEQERLRALQRQERMHALAVTTYATIDPSRHELPGPKALLNVINAFSPNELLATELVMMAVSAMLKYAGSSLQGYQRAMEYMDLAEDCE